MGSVYRGIPQALALTLRDRVQALTFVETGTLMGQTALWAASHFHRVHTIELNTAFIEQAQRRCGLAPIVFYQGHSEKVMPQLLRRIDTPTVFWLDAHWSGDLGYAILDDMVCPVLREIEAVNPFPYAHAIMVDDARLFGVTPGWPTKASVIDLLQQGGRDVWEQEDVLIGVKP